MKAKDSFLYVKSDVIMYSRCGFYKAGTQGSEMTSYRSIKKAMFTEQNTKFNSSLKYSVPRSPRTYA